MPWAVAAAAIVAGGTIYASEQQKKAAESASEAQISAAQMGMTAEERSLAKLEETLSPYVESGEDALRAQRALMGLEGTEAQQAAVDQIQQNPNFMALVQQGEGALLQNAAATGGLRGGNTQAALAQFRPQMLNQAISDQMRNLGGLTSLGQASAARQAASQQQFGSNMAGLYGNIGQAGAGQALATGQANANIGSTLAALGGMYLGGGTNTSTNIGGNF